MKLPGSRFCQICLPVLASTHEATPASATMNDPIADQQRRAAAGNALAEFPGDVAVGHVASAVGPDGKQLKSAGRRWWQKTSPWPNSGRAAAFMPPLCTRHSSRPVAGS